MRVALIITNLERVKTMKKPKIKICCISSVEEAMLAIRCGASALGLVSAMPSGPGPISEELIADIIGRIPPGIATFLLTSKQDAASIISQQKKTKASTLQLVDAISTDVYKELRRELPGTTIVQVIHVTDTGAIEQSKESAQYADMLLLDSGNPNLKVKELGGTGRRHDWNISKSIVQSVDKPVFLAGGLNPQNVREAIDIVHPYGVDICSGVRTNGKLDEVKLTSFIQQVL